MGSEKSISRQEALQASGFPRDNVKIGIPRVPTPPRAYSTGQATRIKSWESPYNLPLSHEDTPAASLAGLGQASGWSPCPARGFVLHPLPNSPGLEPVTKATSTGPLVSEFQVVMFPHPSLGAEPTRW